MTGEPATATTAPHPEPVEGRTTLPAEAAEESLIDEVLRQTPRIAAPQFAIPRNWDEVEALAKRICDAGWCPKSHMRDGKPNQPSVELAILQGMELGVAPLLAVQGIAIINGVPAIWGDLMLAVVLASGLLEAKRETIEGTGDDMRAVCSVRRIGRTDACTRSFSVAMAKRAGLAGKSGPWQGYPSRMLQMRARSWALRDEFADVLRGMASLEELRDSGALARAIEATEAGGAAAAITAELTGAAAAPDDPPATSEDAAPQAPAVAPGDQLALEPADRDAEGPTEAEWTDAAQAMIARLDEARSAGELEVLVASQHIKPELERMATAAQHQHQAVTDFIAEKRRGFGG